MEMEKCHKCGGSPQSPQLRNLTLNISAPYTPLWVSMLGHNNNICIFAHERNPVQQLAHLNVPSHPV